LNKKYNGLKYLIIKYLSPFLIEESQEESIFFEIKQNFFEL